MAIALLRAPPADAPSPDAPLKPSNVRVETRDAALVVLHKVLAAFPAHFVPLQAVYQTDTSYVMVLAPTGPQLFDQLVRKPPPWPESNALRLFAHVVAAVAQLQRLKIAHRDIKLETMVFNNRNQLQLHDFALARHCAGTLATSCGSPHYVAPEVILGKPYDALKSDIWSMGVVLYVLLCGHLPFEDEDIPQLLRKVVGAKYSIDSDIIVSERTHLLLQRMLNKDPQERITIQQIIEEYPELNLRPLPSYDSSINQDLDMETLEELSVILGDPVILRQDLLSLSPSYSKTMYNLLYEFNSKHGLLEGQHNVENTEIHEAPIKMELPPYEEFESTSNDPEPTSNEPAKYRTMLKHHVDSPYQHVKAEYQAEYLDLHNNSDYSSATPTPQKQLRTEPHAESLQQEVNNELSPATPLKKIKTEYQADALEQHMINDLHRDTTVSLAIKPEPELQNFTPKHESNQHTNDTLLLHSDDIEVSSDQRAAVSTSIANRDLLSDDSTRHIVSLYQDDTIDFDTPNKQADTGIPAIEVEKPRLREPKTRMRGSTTTKILKNYAALNSEDDWSYIDTEARRISMDFSSLIDELFQQDFGSAKISDEPRNSDKQSHFSGLEEPNSPEKTTETLDIDDSRKGSIRKTLDIETTTRRDVIKALRNSRYLNSSFNLKEHMDDSGRIGSTVIRALEEQSKTSAAQNTHQPSALNEWSKRLSILSLHSQTRYSYRNLKKFMGDEDSVLYDPIDMSNFTADDQTETQDKNEITAIQEENSRRTEETFEFSTPTSHDELSANSVERITSKEHNVSDHETDNEHPIQNLEKFSEYETQRSAKRLEPQIFHDYSSTEIRSEPQDENHGATSTKNHDDLNDYTNIGRGDKLDHDMIKEYDLEAIKYENNKLKLPSLPPLRDTSNGFTNLSPSKIPSNGHEFLNIGIGQEGQINKKGSKRNNKAQFETRKEYETARKSKEINTTKVEPERERSLLRRMSVRIANSFKTSETKPMVNSNPADMSMRVSLSETQLLEGLHGLLNSWHDVTAVNLDRHNSKLTGKIGSKKLFSIRKSKFCITVKQSPENFTTVIFTKISGSRSSIRPIYDRTKLVLEKDKHLL